MKHKTFFLFNTLLIGLLFLANTVFAQEVTFPRPFGIAIDDMGWNQGSSQGNEGGPWRAGLRRTFDIHDYTPIVEIGKGAGIRIMGLFILSEMDKENVCAKYPTTTKAGAKFDNSANVSAEQNKIMNYVKENSANFEFGLHGVGHEHFDQGVRTRAEWYDIQNHKPWSEQDSRDHMKAFKEILAQYGITKENGQSFPESYVPCAYAYYWNPNGKFSTGKLMAEAGVKYANTLFEQVQELNPPIEFGGGFDNGLLIISRYNYGNEWWRLSALPTQPLEEYKSDVIETHFPNLLAQDYFLQDDLNKQWIAFFKNVQKNKDHYLAKNSEQMYSQWLYKHYAKVEITKGHIAIDNTKMPDVAYERNMLGNMVLKVQLPEGKHVSEASINGKQISAYFEDEGFGFIYLPRLEKTTYEVTYAIGESTPKVFVNNTGTYNVYNVNIHDNNMSFSTRVYGTQDILIKCPKPAKVESNNPNLKIVSFSYDAKTGFATVQTSAHDMQGESGQITINF